MKKTSYALLAVLFLFSSCSSGPFDINQEGGTVYTLECDPLQFILNETRHTSNPGLLKALEATVANKAPLNKVFFDVFLEKYEALNPGGKLASVFFAADREGYALNMTNAQVKAQLLKLYTETLDRTQVVISRRLENFGIPENERKVYKNRQDQIVVEVAKNYPKQRIRKLLQSTAELGFFETYENVETFSYLKKINDELATEIASDSSVQPGPDSLQRKFPLLSILKMNIHQAGDHSYQMELESGCRIGFASLRDTAKINRLLNSETARLLLPADMCLVWGAWPEDMGDVENMLCLYSLKTKSIYYPVLHGDVIIDARVDKDPQMGRPVVSINMSEQGSKQWEEITERNTKHAIAIVLDGYVYSAPIVEGKIPNGQSVIAGNFTLDEAEDLANVLKASRFPGRIRIIDEKKVEPKK
jgi:SecD/SecF fusion protein